MLCFKRTDEKRFEDQKKLRKNLENQYHKNEEIQKMHNELADKDIIITSGTWNRQTRLLEILNSITRIKMER
jgi:hypothetical protein